MRLAIRTAGIAIVILALAVGCSSAEEDTAEANAAVCSSLGALKGTVDQATDGVANAIMSGEPVPAGQGEVALNAIAAAYKQVQADVVNLSSSVSEQMSTAVEDYETSLQAVAEDDTDQSARDDLRVATQDLASSYQAVLSELGC